MELPKFKAVGLTWPYVVRRYLPKLFIAKCWVKKRSCIPFCKSQASVPSSCNAAAAPCPAPTAGADPFNTVPLQQLQLSNTVPFILLKMQHVEELTG